MKFTSNLEESMNALTQKGAFLTAKSEGLVNTMTISWGFIGMFWAKPIFIVGVRPQRYTKEIIDKAASFTVSVPFGTLAEELKICGTKSGKDIDKSTLVEFVPAKKVDSPVVKGCNMYYECEILTADDLKEAFIPEDIRNRLYKQDYHKLYFGQIIETYDKI